MNAIEDSEDGALLHVRVQPKASRNELRIESDGRIRIAVTAPPVQDAANKALREYVAKRFRIGRRAVELVRGGKARDKTLRLRGISAEEAWSRLHS